MEDPQSERPSVLIVDDESSIRGVLRDVTRRMFQASTLEAKDAQEALVLFAQRHPDVVITDIRMPGMDGLTLLRKMKEQDPAIPVILITGFPSLDMAIQGMKEGASDFLTKPFSIDQVQLVLQKALRERKLLQDYEGLRREMHQKRAIEQLNERLHRKVEEMSALCALGETIAAQPLNRDAILRSLISEARQATRAQHMSFLVLDDGSVRFRVLMESSGAQVPARSQGHGNWALPTEALSQGKPMLGERVWRPSDPSFAGAAGSNGDNSQIAVPLLIKGEVMGVIHAVGKLQGADFDLQDLQLISELSKRASLGLENKYLYESIFDVLMSTLKSLVSTIEARDPYTRQHSQRVTDFSVLIAKEMGCSEEQIDTVRVAGYLHDLGKLGVKDSVLLKPGPLTTEEFDQIKAHPVIGEEIIAPIGFLPEERALVRHHHERWDGRGYPDGLAGEEIPLLARVITVADVFDAMTSDRPYRPAMSFQNGLDEILRCSGTQFDPHVVEAFKVALPGWLGGVRAVAAGRGV
jgi:response regulator RpfG family c-di-GMP phosphodiesterase